MSKMPTNLIRAAGGLLWRKNGLQAEILLIHRPRYDDWALPKGKLKKDERWGEAALREVAEETGYRTTLGEFAGVLFYIVRGRPKVVLFWNMHPVVEDPLAQKSSDTPDEVSEVVWLPVPDALQRLSYPDEGELLQREAERLQITYPSSHRKPAS